MCLLVIAHQQHDDYPLILVANRDEFYQRPTTPAHFWKDEPCIFAGRDELQGGTWLGMHRNGRIAAITNFREASSLTNERGNHPVSRGELTSNFLLSPKSAIEYIEELAPVQNNYQGYNLLLWENYRLYYCSNRTDDQHPLDAGVYGISNGVLDSDWPKVTLAKQSLQTCLHLAHHPQSLLKVLDHREQADENALPDTGVGIEAERLLSPCFIQSDEYGTRSTTVITVNTAGIMEYVEQTWIDGAAGEQRYLKMQLPD
jgi:uncharacterized protein with NRDE domain